jgi:hypothetical protein
MTTMTITIAQARARFSQVARADGELLDNRV